MPSLSISSRLGSAKSLRPSVSPIAYLGRENETLNGGYAVTNWSKSSVTKKFVANNRYGTSGFYQFRVGDSDIYEAVGNGNNLGISASSQPTLFSHPSFATVVGFAGTFVNFGGYPAFTAPDGLFPYRTGALSIPINQGPYNSPSGTNSSYVGPAFSITMTENADFLLGIAVDTAADNAYAPRYVSVFTPSVGTIFSTPIPTGGASSIPRLPVFSIKGKTGDQFIAGLWQDNGVNNVAPFSLITFDRI